MTNWLALLLVVFALASLSCGFASPKPTPTPRPTEIPITAGAEVLDLIIDGTTYRSAEIKVGTFVRWTNKSALLHTVTHLPPVTGVSPAFDNTMQADDTYVYQFTEPGEFQYSCRIHPNQRNGFITVTE